MLGCHGVQANLVVVPDSIVVPVDGYRASIRADDPVFSRGDGIFETLLVRDGLVCLMGEHLRRLARSAALIGLDGPADSMWIAAVTEALEHWRGVGEAALRLVLGRDGVAFAMVSAVPSRLAKIRESGVSVMTLNRPTTPLVTAKSLSYAVNSSAVRYAQQFGCDDVIFVDDDGAVLEGPRSAIVVAVADAESNTVLLTPDSSEVLPSITQRAVFDAAGARGLCCRYDRLSVADLIAAQGVWLVSSLTLAARVHTLDGVELADSALDPLVRELIDTAMSVLGR